MVGLIKKMFTGIIEQTGKVQSLAKKGAGGRLYLVPRRPFARLSRGESIAVDGCCLTVVDFKKKEGGSSTTIVFDLSSETKKRTTLWTYRVGTLVNLERALRRGDRLGGHFVLGHVDGVGKIKAIKRYKGSLEMRLALSAGARHAVPLLVDKGSIAVNGVSLTICNPKKMEFTVFIVPHTEKITNLGFRKEGDPVNLEMDVLGKYMEGLISKEEKGIFNKYGTEILKRSLF